MHAFTDGDLVQVTGAVMTGHIGTVVLRDEQQGYLVRIDATTQGHFAEDDLALFTI